MDIKKLPQEHIMTLDISGVRAVKLVCTPEALREFVVGFLYNEGVIASPADISSLDIARDLSRAAVTLAAVPNMGAAVRASGLGGEELSCEPPLCVRPVARRFSIACMLRCADEMDSLAVKYRETGGMHCSALFDGSRLLALYEDVGRHNTLDKLAGFCLINGADARDTLLVTTGRISSDMVRKAARIGASAIASYTTPTQRACDAAQAANITLAGYIKKGGTVYTVPERAETEVAQ